MFAVEFRTRIADGIIQVPEKYRRKLKFNVKVILLAEDAFDSTSDIIEELLESPLKVPDFRPYKREEIYDQT